MARTPYVKRIWKYLATGGTPMNPAGFQNMEDGIQGVDLDLGTAEADIAAIKSLLAAGGGSAVGYTRGTTFPPPTLGGAQFFYTVNHKLYTPGGDAWYDGDGVAATVSGSAGAPQSFNAAVQSDGTTALSWVLPTPPSGQTITAVTVRSADAPSGVSGMPLAGSATTNTRPSSTQTINGPLQREYWVTCTFSGGTESAESTHQTVNYPYGSSGDDTGGSGGSTGGSGTNPMSFLGVGSGYYCNLGIGLPTGHTNIPYSVLVDGYTKAGYVTLNAAGNGVILRSRMDGATTTTNTHYARDETREQNSSGDDIYFNMTNGTHSWEYVFNVGHIQPHKPICTIGQWHDQKSDALAIQLKTSLDGNRASMDLVARFYDVDHATKLLTGYNATLGVASATQIRVKVVFRSGGICDIYCNNVLKITDTQIRDKAPYSGAAAPQTGYWKLGLYPQAHSNYASSGATKEDPNEYTEATFFSHVVTHSPSLD